MWKWIFSNRGLSWILANVFNRKRKAICLEPLHFFGNTTRAHKIIELGWEEMQELVAGILRAMGYKTLISQSGADRGKDIEASPDGLMLKEPRILVQVKHRSNQMGSN